MTEEKRGYPESKRGWFDGTINLPTLLSAAIALVGACALCVSTYASMDRRVTILEQHDIATIENRSDVRDSLKAINDKLDRLNDRLLSNSADQRPDTQRWTK